MIRNIEGYGKPFCNHKAVVQGKGYRFTVLTPSLIRMEYSESGSFENRATQTVMNRDFPVPEFQVIEQENFMEIHTKFLTLSYQKQAFSQDSLKIKVIMNTETGEHKIWHYGDEIKDLKGTARTLDEIDGELQLEHGLISRNGFSLIDDSTTMVITEEGWVETRVGKGCDLYFLGYGHRYQECICDFYELCGKTPLIPRWALGNWWSRYHKYQEEEYRKLMTRFQEEHLPFSVAVIDMDWHLVDIPPKYGSGWTGYTWNRELFPNPPAFLNWLHEQGMKVTLNVHPADGVRAHEDAYPGMAKAVGIDSDSEEPVAFDVTNPAFLEAYFKLLHHPMEEEGVDFWWIDWQQGIKTKIPGLDPLWMLNHYHYLDSMRKNEYGLTFSRYAGIGSHRYPIGFSGDTIISWKSLVFQPYFTATASNVGYGWWSHDIGGHMFGTRDDELAVRWMQLGVFSPINRLHSSSSPFSGKEPWNFNKRAELIMGGFLRLRHELIPYLYTMNRYASRDGQPLIQPLYWKEPEQEEAYEFPNEYYFGSELLIAPITEKMDCEIETAKVKVWLPEGIWFDYQNNRMYQGGRKMTLYRTLEEMPIMVKAGGIVVRSLEKTNTTDNPLQLAVDIFPGSDNQFTLWEDNGSIKEDSEENWTYTNLNLKYGKDTTFIIDSIQGNQESIPPMRSWKLLFRYMNFVDAEVLVEGKKVEVITLYDEEQKTLSIELSQINVRHRIEILFREKCVIAKIDRTKQAFELLNRAQISYGLKENILEVMKKQEYVAISTLQSMELNPTLFGALLEILEIGVDVR